MYPAEPLTPFQKKLTRICLRMNHIVLAVLFGIGWPFLQILIYSVLAVIPFHQLPTILKIPLGLVYALLPFSILPLGLFSIMAINNYAQTMSMFLPEAAPRDIPEGKFDRDLANLVTVGEPIVALGSEECDRYYLCGAYHLLVIVYKHPETNIYWSTVRLIGRMNFISLGSCFDNELTLETTRIQAAGKLPVRIGGYLQITKPNTDLQALLSIHQDAIALFEELGYACQAREDGRYTQLLNMQRQSSHMRTFAYWPIQMTAWVLFRSNYQYCKPLREQVAAGTTAIAAR
jgi:hypothetical protein